MQIICLNTSPFQPSSAVSLVDELRFEFVLWKWTQTVNNFVVSCIKCTNFRMYRIIGICALQIQIPTYCPVLCSAFIVCTVGLPLAPTHSPSSKAIYSLYGTTPFSLATVLLLATHERKENSACFTNRKCRPETIWFYATTNNRSVHYNILCVHST